MPNRPPWLDYQAPQGVTVPLGPPDPAKELQETRTRQEIALAGQTAAATADKARADASKAQLDLKTAQEAYDSAHPKGTGATVIGPDSLKNLSVPDQELVKALADGRLAFPGGFALKAPWWQQKLEQVAQYDPTFDATNFNNRAKARAMLLSGKVGASSNALNTMIGHTGLLDSQISGTASHSVTGVNAVENWVDQHLLGQSGITNYKDTAAKLASEETSVYRNGGGAEADVSRYLQSFDPNAAEKQKRDVVRNTLDLAASKQAANLYQYNLGSGGKPPVDLLDPDARKVLDRFPDIRDKYFSAAPGPMSASAVALLKSNGGSPPPPPSAGLDIAPPTLGPGGVPHADYSGAGQGPNAGVATGQTRNVYDPVTSAKLNALAHRGASVEMANAILPPYTPPITASAWNAAAGYAKSHPKWMAAEATTTVPTTALQRFSASPLAAGIVGAGTGTTAGLSDVAGRAIAGPGWDANRQALSALNPKSDLAGNVLGGTAAMFGGGAALKGLGVGAEGSWLAANPIKAAALGDSTYGGIYGASENPDHPFLGAAIGAPAAALTSVAGQGLAKGIGAGLTGVTNPAVQRLRAAGIPLTVGEVLGGGWKKAQDAATSIFGPGNMIARRYNDGRRAVSSAMFNDAGNIVDTPINAVGQKGVQALDAAKSNAYSNALEPISLNLSDPSFTEPMRGVIEGADAIPAGELAPGYAGTTIRRFVGGNIDPETGLMSGPDFQKAYRGLSQTAGKASSKVEGHDLGQSLGQAKDILVAALQGQDPIAYNAFLKANSANRHLNVLADAVKAAKNQINDAGEVLPTPAQFGTASTNNAAKYSGNIAAASGDRPFNQIINDAQQVMSSKVPDSGTPMRLLTTALATGGAGGLGYGANGGEGAAEGGAATLAGLSLLGTRRGQQLMTAALLNRVAPFRIAGGAARRNPQLGGDILTSMGIPLLAGQ